MSTYVDGDVSLNKSGCPTEVYSIDEACQRVRFILTAKRGSFIYNREFGADFSSVNASGDSSEATNKLTELLCREALAEQKEISVSIVSAASTDSGKIHIKLKVLFGEESKTMEVDV